jgi:eukaryotic-like serine/threonine-protein kinase
MAHDDPGFDTIFAEAIEIPSAEGRAAFLARSCGEDEGLRRRLERLIEAHFQAGSFLESPPAPPTDLIAPTSPIEVPGKFIGPYKLLQQIGEGGMGVVYMAEQEQPVRRRVALKVIKPGMDTAQVVARFEAERQALALMDHPNIARVLDAGATESGRPYFVMELVNGILITEYCDQARLTPRGRLELFVPVCRAIQHAHQKGVIHRDIKPSNVMITLVDGRPTPRVIDFGVAKATGQRLTERSLFTQFGAIVGTLEYMSPEQAELSALDVDTRSDVFSLGVLLYELLTGSTPLERSRLREAGFAEILRRIREEEPPTPSTRLSGSGEALPSIAASRHTEPTRLARLVRGELDWIAMRALEKDRTRRYDSVGSLAADVERYLADEAVEACPPSRRYRLGKFARKHRVALFTAAAFAAVLLAATAVSGYLALRASAAEQLAKSRLADSEQARKQAEAVSDFMVEAFGKTDPDQDGRDLKVVDMLEAAEGRLGLQFAGSPAIHGALLRSLGDTYRALGLPDRAVEVATRALPLIEGSLGPDHPETLFCRNSLACAYADANRRADAIPLAQKTLELAKARFGRDHGETIDFRNTLVGIYSAAGRAADAVSLGEESLRLAEASLGPDHESTLAIRQNLTMAYTSVGRPADAVGLGEKALRLAEASLGPDHNTTRATRASLSYAYLKVGRIPEAIALGEENLRRQESRLGPDHPLTIMVRSDLGDCYRDAGRMAEALPLYEKNDKLASARLGPDHYLSRECRVKLADSLLKVGRTPEAIPLLEGLEKQFAAKPGPDHPETMGLRALLAESYRRAGRKAEGIAMDEGTVRLARAKTAPPLPSPIVDARLAEDYEAAGRWDDLIALRRGACEVAIAVVGPADLQAEVCRSQLSQAYVLAGRVDEAIAVEDEALKLLKARFGPDHPCALACLSNLAFAHRQAGHAAQAVGLGEQSLRLNSAKFGRDDPTSLVVRYNLATVYHEVDRDREALDMLLPVAPAIAKAFGSEHPGTIKAATRLAGLLAGAGRWAEAEPVARRALVASEAKQPDDWVTFQARSLLGACLLSLGKPGEAEPLILVGYEGLKARRPRIMPSDRPLVAEAAARIVRLYQARGDAEQAARWREKLAAAGDLPADPPPK